MDKQTLLKSSTLETSVPINEWEVVSPGEFPTSATHADTPANFEDWVKAYPGEIGRSFTPVLEQKEGPATETDATDSWIKAAARTVVKIPSLIKSGVLIGAKGMASGMESRATASAEMYEDVAATAGDKDYVPPLQ